MSSLALRNVNTREESLRRYALATGKNYLTLTSPPKQSFVHIIATLNDSAIHLYCDTGMLLQRCSVETEALPIEMIDKNLLAGLASRYFSIHKLTMPVSQQSITLFSVMGVVDGSDLSLPLISMTPTEAFIWARVADIVVPALPESINKSDWTHLALQMQVILGHTVISYIDMCDLRSGDMLVLDVPDSHIILANIYKMQFKIEGDYMSIAAIDEYNAELADESITLMDTCDLSIDNVEFKVAFLLEERTMTLAELQTLQVNAHLPLQTAGTQVNVSLCVGKHIIATGELVRIDDRLAVEIHNIKGRV